MEKELRIIDWASDVAGELADQLGKLAKDLEGEQREKCERLERLADDLVEKLSSIFMDHRLGA